MELRTGSSDCSDPLTDAACLTAGLEYTLEVVDPEVPADDDPSLIAVLGAPYVQQFMDMPYVHLAYTYDAQGTWIEPSGLHNFAIIDPSVSWGIKFWCGRTLAYVAAWSRAPLPTGASSQR